MLENSKTETGRYVISFHLSCNVNVAVASTIQKRPKKLADYWTISANLWERRSTLCQEQGVQHITKRLVASRDRSISPDALSISVLLDIATNLLGEVDLCGAPVTWDLAELGSTHHSCISIRDRFER